MIAQFREKAGLLAMALARHAAYFDYDAARCAAQIDDVDVDMPMVMADYEAACLELRRACSMEVDEGCATS